MITTNVTDEQRETMKAFLATLGITDVEYNIQLSELNKRAVFNAKNPTDALAAAKAALPDSVQHHVNDAARSITTFRIDGLGSVKIGVHRIHRRMAMPIHVIPALTVSL